MAVLIKYDIRDVPLEEVAARHATLTAAGVGINKQVGLLADEFGYSFTRTQIERLKGREIYHRVLKEYHESIVKKAVSELRVGVSKLIPKVVEALEKSIDDGSVPAMALALKAIGVENMEPESKQAQSITVVLPGQKQIKVVNEDTGDK